MVIFITGKASAGKSTLARALNMDKQAIILDGDEVRKNFPVGFTESARKDHILRMAKLAAVLEAQGKTVIIAAIMPKKEWRIEARNVCKESILIYVPGGFLWPNTIYEEPTIEERFCVC